MLDIDSWVLSPEIREYLRENYRPGLMERQALIRGAYRSIEEKLSALRELCPEAETADERIFLEKVIKVYQFAIQEIRQCRRDEFYLCRTALRFGGDSGLFAYPFTYLGDIKTDICRSYEQLGGKAENCVISSGYTVQKWRRKGEWSPVLGPLPRISSFISLYAARENPIMCRIMCSRQHCLSSLTLIPDFSAEAAQAANNRTAPERIARSGPVYFTLFHNGRSK